MRNEDTSKCRGVCASAFFSIDTDLFMKYLFGKYNVLSIDTQP